MNAICTTCGGAVGPQNGNCWPAFWCSCPPKPDPKDAEIARLRALVLEAYYEGQASMSYDDCGMVAMIGWDESNAKKALDQ